MTKSTSYETSAYETSSFTTMTTNFNDAEVEWTVPNFLNVSDNVSEILSDWQKSELSRQKSESGIRCLLNMWFSYVRNDTENELQCNATWDNVYCWPPIRAGENITRPCSFVFQDSHPQYASHLKGDAIRVCLENGTWSRGFRTNYEECAKSLLEYENENENNGNLVVLVQYMVFIGAILSLISLGSALLIFCCFRRVWSERIKVHVHLMLALVIRFIVFLIITEPHVLGRKTSYRDNNLLCKTVLSAHLYSTVASVSWMLVQGMYLNGKLTTDVFESASRKKFRLYYFIGWVLPFILLVIYIITMVIRQHSEACWKGYAEMNEIWILFIPTIVALMLNGVFLCNILRIVLQKGKSASLQSEFSRVLSIAKATLFLFPILGLNNLLLLYNPGGEYETFYVSLNTFFGSTQGIFVAIVYCFNCTEVHEAIKRSYKRYRTRRSVGNVTRRSTWTSSFRLANRVSTVQQNEENPVGVLNNDV